MYKNIIFIYPKACQSAGVVGMAATTKCLIAAGSSTLVGGTQYIFSKVFGTNNHNDDHDNDDNVDNNDNDDDDEGGKEEDTECKCNITSGISGRRNSV